MAGLVAAVQQGLRKAARDRRGDDLRGDEPAHATQVSASSMKRSRLGFVFTKLPLETVYKGVRVALGGAIWSPHPGQNEPIGAPWGPRFGHLGDFSDSFLI